MIVLRLVPIFVLSILLTGCIHRKPMECPPPGAEQTRSDCYYSLLIKDYDSATSEVAAQVPVQVVEENEDKSGGFTFRNFFSDFIKRIVGDGKENYAFFTYHFKVKDLGNNKITRDAVIDFHGVKDEKELRFGRPLTVAAEYPCPPPGQTSNQQCYYRLTVKSIDASTGLVTGIVPSSVIEENAKLSPHLAKKTYPFEPYTFHVRDTKGLMKDSDYDFVSVVNTNYLQRCVKDNCQEYFSQ